MKILPINYYQNINNDCSYVKPSNKYIQNYNTQVKPPELNKAPLSFTGGPVQKMIEYLQFLDVQRYVNTVNKVLAKEPNADKLLFKNLSMEAMEGIQYGIEVFKGLSMKDIQYMSENLHVIAVKRGCKNMCGYCYADAKPFKREMSWEDFKLITDGFKKLRKRLGNLPLFGENMTKNDKEALLYRSTELFYDSDCIDLVIKDKKGKEYDFIDLANELNNSLNRKTVFDTSGWDPNNNVLQQRAEKYAQYFSESRNMEKLNAFNLSFNCFNASYITGVKALKSGNAERFSELKNRYTDRIANAIFTFTPVLKSDNFHIMTRSFGLNARNAEYFDIAAMFGLIDDVSKKLEKLYKADLNGLKKYVKSEVELKENVAAAVNKMKYIDTALNSSGRMKQFMETFGIKAPMQNHNETTSIMANDLKTLGRYHRYIGMKLIDADGKVYHMDYARFFPTEIQLNIKDKSPAPRLANLREDFPVSKEIINKAEIPVKLDDLI